MATSEADRRRLLRIARDAIAAHVGRLAHALDPDGELASRRGAAFVTIYKGSELRGCIGHVEPDLLLATVVARCAVAACSADPRFPPVVASELPQLAIELSLLGPLEPIAGPEDIAIGRHGLVVERGSRRGLLLPQVALEWEWDSRTFLMQTCRKAGLAPDAWTGGATIRRFEAEVFTEMEVGP